MKDEEVHVPENKPITARIMRCRDQDDWPGALAAFEEVRKPSVIVYNAMMITANTCGRQQEGLCYFEQMEPLGLVPNHATYSIVLSLLGSLGHYDRARELWEDLRKRGIQLTSHSLTGLLNAAAGCGMTDAALEHLKVAVKDGIKVDIPHFGCLLSSCRSAKTPARAILLLRRIRAARRQDIRATVVHYTIALQSCLAALQSCTLSKQDFDMLVDIVLKEKAKDKVLSDPYFVQMQLAALLRAPSLEAALAALGSQPPERLAPARELLRQVAKARMKDTPPTENLRAALAALDATADMKEATSTQL